jgi:phospholipase/carboxylesterase
MLDAIELRTGEKIGASVIWMHGLGADGHDFEPIVPLLGLPASTGVRFLFPHAPHRPVTINNGYVMRAWYDVFGIYRGAPQDESGIRDSENELRALIRRETERGVLPRRIVLAGFSQGGAMALHTGLRFEERLAGILALSCYLPLAESLEEEHSRANAETPILMIHGRDDAVIPLPLGRVGYERLVSLGHPIEWREYPMGHEVTPDEIGVIGRWLGPLLTQGVPESR